MTESGRCQALTSKGVRCSFQAKEDAHYCARHVNYTPLKTCEGKTLQGKPCINRACEGQSFCKLHQHARPEVKCCKGKTEKGKECRNKAKDGSDYCGVHSNYTSQPREKPKRRTYSQRSNCPKCGQPSFIDTPFCYTHYFEELFRSKSRPQPRHTSSPAHAFLEVPITATKREIREAYLRLSKVHHPDKGGDPEKFKLLQKHYASIK